jgi:hypothetical protein
MEQIEEKEYLRELESEGYDKILKNFTGCWWKADGNPGFVGFKWGVLSEGCEQK